MAHRHQDADQHGGDAPPMDYERRVSTTEAERIAVTAAKLASNDALNELMAVLGVARGNIDSVERFKEDIRAARALRERPEIWLDLDFLHAMRNGSVKAAARVGLTILTILTGAFLYGVWGWLKTAIRIP